MRVKLDKVCKRIYAGGDVPKDRYSTVKTAECAIPIYANAEKDNGLYGYTDTARENELSITVAARGTIGFTAIRREPFLPVVRLITVVPDLSTVSERYLYYALRNCKPASSGTSIPQLTVPDIKKNEIELYSLSVQETIADKLDAVGRVIELRQQQLQKLDELVKARFIELFGTETEFDKWPCCTIGDVADVCVGVVIKPTQYYTDTGIPTFRSLNIGEMHVKDSDWVYFTEEGHQKNQKSVVHKNDVLVVRSGAPGTACVATEKYDGYNAVDIIIAHPDNSKVNSIFLAAFTNMPHGMNQIRERTGGAAQQHFNVGGYKAMRLIMPSIELQNQYAAFVEQTDKSKVAVQKALDEAQLLFDSLMQKYFG